MDASNPDLGTFMTKFRTVLQAETPILWVFGYGSLLWKPNFEYSSYRVGYVENYERKFNQGNETFRGTKGKPGRVANLEERRGGRVWGLAYEVRGKDAVTTVLENLYNREIASGNYTVAMTKFQPRKCCSINHDILDDVGNTDARCCTDVLHNIPLPHPPCGLSKKTNNPQNAGTCCLSKPRQTQTPGCSSFQASQQQQPLPACVSPHSSPTSLSLSWLTSYMSTRRTFAKSNLACPCFSQKDPQPASRQISMKTSSHHHHSNHSRNHNSRQFTESRSRVQKASSAYEISMSLDKVENHLNNSHRIDHPTFARCVQNRTFKESQSRSSNTLSNTHARELVKTMTTSFIPPRKPLNGLDPNITIKTTKSQDVSELDGAPIDVLLFTVTKGNCLYLGSHDDVDKMATQIIETGGSAGTNVEYVLKISDFIKTFIPEDDDKHLFQLDDAIREKLRLSTCAENETKALQQWDMETTKRINS